MRLLLKVLIVLVVCGVMTSVGVNIYITRQVADRIYTTETTPTRRVALVFGAAVRRDGSLSAILDDRVDAAVELYQTKKVAKLLMSGDNGSNDYDEVSAMKKAAIAKGVPAEDITLDYAGFSTYESCYRAKEIFGVTDPILVTQRYHLTRALYSCRELGLDPVGVALPDFEKYPDLRVSYSVREFFALNKAWLELHLLHPTPKFLGKFEGPI